MINFFWPKDAGIGHSYLKVKTVEASAPGMWPFKRGGLSSDEEINISMFRFTSSSGLSR